jgi:peptidase E
MEDRTIDAGPRLRRPIMAIGGGSFGHGVDRSPLDDHWLALARARRGRDRPRICFIGTATGDDPGLIESFHRVFGELADTSHLALFDRTVEALEPFLLDHDAVYVGGGNTASLLAVWRAHGVDRALVAAHDGGVVLAGRSAGSICWFEGGTTDSFGPALRGLTGALAFIPGSNSPHYDGEAQRRPLFQRLVGEGSLPPGIAVDDHAAAVFDGPRLVEVVASRAGPTAYRVERTAAGVVETSIPARVLMAAPA